MYQYRTSIHNQQQPPLPPSTNSPTHRHTTSFNQPQNQSVTSSSRIKQKSIKSQSLNININPTHLTHLTHTHSSKPTTLISRFPQARLLVLILRKLFRSKISAILHVLKTKQKVRYNNYLNGLEDMVERRVKAAFLEILGYGKKRVLKEIKGRIDRVNRRIFLIGILDKLYGKVCRDVLHNFNSFSSVNQVNYKKLQQAINHIQNQLLSSNIRLSFRTIFKKSQKSQTLTLKSSLLLKILNKLYIKSSRSAFHKLYHITSQKQYDNLYSLSQQKRKSFYDFQNNKRQQIANQRQNMHNLKLAIDNHAYQRNVKMGEMKRQKAIKISQTQQKILNLERKLEQSRGETRQYQKAVFKMNLILNKRQNLRQISTSSTAVALSLTNIKSNNKSVTSPSSSPSQLPPKITNNAMQKVHNLFNQLKYQDDYRAHSQTKSNSSQNNNNNNNQQNSSQIRSSSIFSYANSKIILNKQKFKQYLQQFQNLKQNTQFQQFHIYNNIKNRNLICLYQNISQNILSLQLSEQYIHSYQQNQWLKELLNSLLAYHLLKDKGDNFLQENNNQLEMLFQQMFEYSHAQQYNNNNIINNSNSNNYYSHNSNSNINNNNNNKLRQKTYSQHSLQNNNNNGDISSVNINASVRDSFVSNYRTVSIKTINNSNNNHKSNVNNISNSNSSKLLKNSTVISNKSINYK